MEPEQSNTDHEEIVVVCSRVDSNSSPTGVVIANCHFCDARIWVSHSTLALTDDYKMMCAVCMNAIVPKAEEVRVMAPNDEQIKEIAKHSGCSEGQIRADIPRMVEEMKKRIKNGKLHN